MSDHNASIQTSHTLETVVTGDGPHYVRAYVKKQGETISQGDLVSLTDGELVAFDPAGDVPVKGVAEAVSGNSVSVCTFGFVRMSLLKAAGTPITDSTFETLEAQHIYPI